MGLSSVRTILVVGTADARRARILDLLTQAGHVAVDVATTDAALAHIGRDLPPLVIMDVARADEVGMAVCRRIKSVSPETFILQIARDFDGEWPIAGADPSFEIDSAIDAYLIEPIQPPEMLALVRSLMRLQKVEADLRDSEDRLTLAQESAGLAILDWMIPTNGLIHSDNFNALFDLPENPDGASLSPAQLLERIHPDDLGGLIAEFSDGDKTAHSFDKEFRIVTRDGGIRWIASRGRFFLGSNGVPERMLSLSSDVTARKSAERANAEFASIVATSIDAILSVDLEGRVTSWNAGAERLFGLPAADMMGRPLSSAFGGDLPASEHEDYQRRLADGEAHDFEIQRVRTDGSPLDIWATSAPMRELDGRVIGSSFIIRDISSQKQREDHIRFLMRELTHRSKNLLAVIQAMARQSVTKGITPEEFVKRFTERLAGLAGSHDLLSSVDWKGASLMELIRSQLNHYAELFGGRIILGGADIFLKPEAAQNIGIALHELSTNAAKYGALSTDRGTVTIDWRVSDDATRLLTLAWRESGGPAVAAPSRKGFGSVVMDRIAGRALGGKSGIVFDPDGVVWTMEVPAAAAIITV